MVQLQLGDCLQLMDDIEDKSVDFILCDLPYGVTRNSWDSVIPFDKLWSHYCRIIKDNGAIVLFGQSVFSAKLLLSNEKMYRYSFVWDKCAATGFLNAKKMPLRCHEDILVFYRKPPVYNPQMWEGSQPSHHRCKKSVEQSDEKRIESTYGSYFISQVNLEPLSSTMKYPRSIIAIPKVPVSKVQHPTQKPVELMEWLIKTYTNECDTVLDNCMGSGTTGVACVRTGRNFIGMELNEDYFKLAKERIAAEQNNISTDKLN